MDAYEATKVVMSRIQTLDPDSASKIMGYILIQDQGEKEMIRLAFVPDSILLSYITQAKACLGFSVSSSTKPNAPFPQSSPRILIPNNGFHFSNPSPSRSSPSPSPSPTPSPRPFSYAAALNASSNSTAYNNRPNASSFDFYGGELSFLDDSVVDPVMSPSGRSDSLVFSYGDEGSPHPLPHPFHRRSSSVNDAAFLSNLEEAGGFGWRPCMYFARGFCKNGSSCKFVHGDGDAAAEVSSPGKSGHGLDELLRMKALQQQRFALMASRGQQHFAYNKCMDFLNENPRNDFSPMGLGAGGNSSSRQIYLTFPADSTFKEEDVSNYFSMFGPVQDVRIPFQQKRMFGFVTFVYPETVKLILAKGNPHFVCDSRVLVKPYKEKGKVAEKKHQQHHLDLSPSAVESRENIDLPFGSRMLFNAQEMMLRRKLEQEVELQQAIERQGRRMMNLQLMDLKDQHHNHHVVQGFRAGLPMSSPRQSQFLMNQNFTSGPDGINQETLEEFDGIRQEPAKSPTAHQKLVSEGPELSNNVVACDKQLNTNSDESCLSESFDHILPDNLFASPTKFGAEHRSVFSEASTSTDDTIPVTITASKTNTPVLPLNMASLKPCYVEIPRFSSGQEAIEM